MLVKHDSRTAFGINFYDSEEEAVEQGAKVRASGQTYNGGYFHGRPCGRDATWDHTDRETGQKLYAVTVS